jgi:hypothetical protein
LDRERFRANQDDRNDPNDLPHHSIHKRVPNELILSVDPGKSSNQITLPQSEFRLTLKIIEREKVDVKDLDNATTQRKEIERRV